MDRRTIGHRLRQAREVAGLTQGEVGKSIGKSQSAISDYERGRLGIELPELMKLAKIVGQPTSYFLDEETPDLERGAETEIRKACRLMETALERLQVPPPGSEPVKWVQWRGEVPGGIPAETLELEYVPVPASLLRNDDVFACTVRGDSMIGRGIRNSDRVIIDPNLSPHDGDIVVARKDDEVVIRIYREDEDGLYLIAAARGYPRLRLQEAIIVGVVTGWFRYHKNKT